MKRILALVLAMLLVISGAACAMEVTSTTVKSGLLRFKDNKKYGYMDINGNVVISAQYIGGEEFNMGLAPVQYSSGGFARWKYIDVSGNTVIGNIDTSSRYYDFGTWQGDYGMVTIWKIKNGAIDPIGYNYITRSGRLITSDEFMYVGKFSDGYALVGAGSAYGKLSRSSAQNDLYDAMVASRKRLSEAVTQARTLAERAGVRMVGEVANWSRVIALQDNVPDEVARADMSAMALPFSLT